MTKTRTSITEWQWRLSNSNGEKAAEGHDLENWRPVSSFPSVIQQELLANQFIPNYHIGENERDIQWAGACDWEYRTTFPTPAPLSSNVDLVFEGLDTYAEVLLNGNVILNNENQFIPARVSVTHLLKNEEQNELTIIFESALKAGTRLEEKFGKHSSMMRDRRRMHLRKAQYSWGWDWGPIVVTSGPWKPVYLEAYDSRIEDVHITTKVAPDHSSADISIEVTAYYTTEDVKATVTITDAEGKQVTHATMSFEKSKTGSIELKAKEPKLWWPNGQGSAHLYTAHVCLLSSTSKTLDVSTTRFGVRTIEVIQRPLKSAPGKTFMFRVNGRDIFSQGGDWIPADNLIPSISRKRYFDWIKVAKFCHLNMIRVWGGGVYESEDFFDACDEMGILVWHDFAFACGDFPTYDGFLKSVEQEAEAQVMRLRNRASLALLAGDNEDFMLADWQQVKYDHSDTTGPFLKEPFPQREIYLSILPKACAKLCPEIQYWPSSPWGGSSANDTTVGDIHQWSVWHLEQKPYQDYKKLSGRFVSEFGMHGFPVQRTVDYFTRGGKETDKHPQSKLIDCHNKGHGAHTRIARYLAENFRFDMTSLRNFVYSSQLMQSEAYGYALRDWKRLFNGSGEELCAGAIIWQLNDVYPSTSWAFVDYFIRPKPAFYNIKRAFAPISVGIERTPNTRWVDEDHPRETEIPTFEVFAHNTTAEEKECTLILRTYDFFNGSWPDLGKQAERTVTLLAGRNNEIAKLDRQGIWTEESLIILEASLVNPSSGEVMARYVDWPEPYRYLNWPKDTGITVSVESLNLTSTGDEAWENKVTVASSQPLKGVWLEPFYDGTEKDDDPEPLWEDNMFDLMPGMEISVLVKGLRGRKVHARFLYDWETEATHKSML